jgi:hypothetical protein
LAVGCGLTRLGRRFSALVGDRSSQSRGLQARSFDIRFEGGRIRKCSERPLGCGDGVRRRGQDWSQVRPALCKTRALRFDPLDRRRRRIACSRSIACFFFRSERVVARLLGFGPVPFHRLEDGGPFAGGDFDRAFQCPKFLGKRRQAICPYEPLGGGRAGAGGHEPIPPPHLPVAGDQSLPNSKFLTVIPIGHRDLAEPPKQLGGSLHMVGETVGAQG